MRPKSIIYIDGFNLEYGILKPTKQYRWLDLEAYFKKIRNHDDIQTIKYFTTKLIPNARGAHLEQQAYLDALSTTPLVQVILGSFKRKQHKCHHCGKVNHLYEEKETDVNLALAMLDDAYQQACDHIIGLFGTKVQDVT